jgi:hypothetical protein
VINSDKLSNDETRRLVATLEKYWSLIGYSLKDLKGISPSLCTHHILRSSIISLSVSIRSG